MITAVMRMIVERKYGAMFVGSCHVGMVDIWMMLTSVPITARSSDKVKPNLRMPFRLVGG